jgi:multidrug efflux pump subunit AcrB
VRIFNRLARLDLNAQTQKEVSIFSAILLATTHVFLCMLFSLYDDAGITPNAPSVFWGIMWSTGIIVGVVGGFLVATVIALFGMEAIGL